jgi:biotin synthase-like enzyme
LLWCLRGGFRKRYGTMPMIESSAAAKWITCFEPCKYCMVRFTKG